MYEIEEELSSLDDLNNYIERLRNRAGPLTQHLAHSLESSIVHETPCWDVRDYKLIITPQHAFPYPSSIFFLSDSKEPAVIIEDEKLAVILMNDLYRFCTPHPFYNIGVKEDIEFFVERECCSECGYEECECIRCAYCEESISSDGPCGCAGCDVYESACSSCQDYFDLMPKEEEDEDELVTTEASSNGAVTQ